MKIPWMKLENLELDVTCKSFFLCLTFSTTILIIIDQAVLWKNTNSSFPNVCVSGVRNVRTCSSVRVRISGKKCSFFGKFCVLCLLETPILRFLLLPYYERYLVWLFFWFEIVNSFILRLSSAYLFANCFVIPHKFS